MSMSNVSSVVPPFFSAWPAMAARSVAIWLRCSGVSARAMHMAKAPCARITAFIVAASFLKSCMSSPLVKLMCVGAISVASGAARPIRVFRGVACDSSAALCPPGVRAQGGFFLETAHG